MIFANVYHHAYLYYFISFILDRRRGCKESVVV